MGNLFKWEMKQTLGSKAFRGIGIAYILGVASFMVMTLVEGEKNGFEIFLSNCSNFNSLLLLLTGIFAGIHISGAFEDRKIQAAVMAGNSRISIVVSKILSFSLSIAVYCITSVAISSAVAFALKGTGEMDGSFLRAVIVRGLVFTFVEVSFASICVVISMLIKNLGASITVNLVALLALNGVCEWLISNESVTEYMRYLPVGQTFYTLGDAGNGNLARAVLVSAAGIAVTFVLAYLKFRKEELK